jgi:hypothetical protein
MHDRVQTDFIFDSENHDSMMINGETIDKIGPGWGE